MKIDLKNLYGSSFEEYYNFKNEHFAHPIMEVVKSKVKSRKCGVLYKDTFDMLRDKDFTLFGNVLLRIPKYKEYLRQIRKEVVAEHYNYCPSSEDIEFINKCIICQTFFNAFCGFIKEELLTEVINANLGNRLVATTTDNNEDIENKTDIIIYDTFTTKEMRLQIKSKTFFNYKSIQTDQQNTINKMKELDGYFVFFDLSDMLVLAPFGSGKCLTKANDVEIGFNFVGNDTKGVLELLEEVVKTFDNM